MLHKYLEASKFSYAHRSDLGDMDFVNTSLPLAKWGVAFPIHPFRNITSEDYVKAIREKITDRAQETSKYGGHFAITMDKGTTNIAVIDGEGNAVVVTTTVNLLLVPAFQR